MREYIHYGCKEFDINKFRPIKNEPYFSKPCGGFWASPVEAEQSWKEWCISNDFRECDESNSFKFILTEGSNVLHLYSAKDLEDLPKLKSREDDYIRKDFLDFEKLISLGYDAVELHLSEEIIDEDSTFMDGLYWKLYGWDCDSILIMNPNIVCEIQ